MEVLFFFVLEIEVKIGQGSLASVGHGLDITYDHRACQLYKFDMDATRWDLVTHLRILFPEPAINPGVISGNSNCDDDRIRTFSVNP